MNWTGREVNDCWTGQEEGKSRSVTRSTMAVVFTAFSGESPEIGIKVNLRLEEVNRNSDEDDRKEYL